MNALSAYERDLLRRGYRHIAGVDEAGRGPLAGPVVAAAVIFSEDALIRGVGDSKTLTERQRDRLADSIRERALCWAIGEASPGEIDEINILQASILAMHRAVEQLPLWPDYLLVDGNRFHHPSLSFETVVKGDGRCFSIAAASILAKTHRDGIMRRLDAEYPGYGFGGHKGYPTKAHIEALRRLGSSPVHRKSFSVKQLSTQ
jgi:ribonuclease HII